MTLAEAFTRFLHGSLLQAKPGIVALPGTVWTMNNRTPTGGFEIMVCPTDGEAFRRVRVIIEVLD